MKRVLIVGGGISGLSAAHRLLRLSASRGFDVRFTILEAGDRLGGKILTESERGLTLECGPDSFLTQKPQALELVRELGLESRLIDTGTQDTGVHVFVRGKLRRLPEGLLLMAPAKVIPFLRSDILSWPGKLRMGLDFVIPKSGGGDVSMGDFARRRFGREAVRAIVQPVMAGIYAGDAEEISLKSTFPRFLEMERAYGSVIRGMRASARTSSGHGASGKARTAFVSLSGGLSELVAGIERTLPPAAVRFNARVTRIFPREGGYKAMLEDGAALDADGVIVTSPAWQASELLKVMDPELGSALLGIPFTSSASLSLVYGASSRPKLPGGFGFVVARGESRVVSAGTFPGTKFPGRVPSGFAVIRCFLGGAGREGELEKKDGQLFSAALSDLERILGIDVRQKPSFWTLHRWPRGNPQYTVGHELRLKRIAACCARHPGLELAGASYEGIGIPDCIASGAKAADSLYNSWASDPS